jgi:hypothetical protein
MADPGGSEPLPKYIIAKSCALRGKLVHLMHTVGPHRACTEI